MNWTAISAISEFVGSVVVIVTLCYVAVQIRQNTKAMLASTRQGLLDADLALISEFMGYAIDPHLIGDEIELTPEDERLDEESWQSYMTPVAGLFSIERAKAVLRFYTGSPEFLRLLAERVNGTGA